MPSKAELCQMTVSEKLAFDDEEGFYAGLWRTFFESEIIKVYTYLEARQRFAEILNIAREEDVIIQRRGGGSIYNCL